MLFPRAGSLNRKMQSPSRGYNEAGKHVIVCARVPGRAAESGREGGGGKERAADAGVKYVSGICARTCQQHADRPRAASQSVHFHHPSPFPSTLN